MRRKKYYAAGELCYSAIYGGGIYRWTGETVQDPLGGSREAGLTAPLLTNLRTGEVFFLKRLPEGTVGRSREQILEPALRGHILWPSDIVHLNSAQQAACGLCVANVYAASSPGERGGADSLLFPYGGYPGMVTGDRKLAQIEPANWRSPQIRAMAVEIVRALESVNRCGYFYGDMHLSRIYFQESGRAFFDYSNLIFSLRAPAEDSADSSEAGKYPIEFADPALVQGLIPRPDFHAQNYSLCALLFYLFLGRYPYDGRLLTGYVDDSPQRHYVKFRDYHKMPVFIFDPEDSKNSLGAFWEEQQVIALWEELPPALQERFVRTLRQENAQRKVPVNNPTPSAWLHLFGALGWCGEEGGGKETEEVANAK